MARVNTVLVFFFFFFPTLTAGLSDIVTTTVVSHSLYTNLQQCPLVNPARNESRVLGQIISSYIYRVIRTGYGSQDKVMHGYWKTTTALIQDND